MKQLLTDFEKHIIESCAVNNSFFETKFSNMEIALREQKIFLEKITKIQNKLNGNRA